MATKLEILIRARDEFSAELKRMEGSLQKNHRNVTRLGLGLTAVGAAGVAGFGLAIKSAIDFESSFAGVRKTVDATEEEFARLEEGFRSMAKQTPINVNEINRIGEAAGQLGIEVKNIEGFTKVMADLGVTTNLASEEAATSLARLANITQLPQTEFDRLGSTVVALGNNLATTESEIVDFGLRIAGAGKQIGLSEAQILAFGGALSSVGISAEAGGTALSRVMVDIAKAVDEGGEKLERFAEVAELSADDFREAFERDAAGAIVTFIEGLGRVKEAGGSTFRVLEELGQGNIRVRDTLLRASGAGDLLRQSLELGSTAWQENTALTEEAEKRYGTTASQLQLLQNRVGGVAISIGQDFLPVLNDSLKVTGDAIELWNVLPEPIQEAAVRLGAAASGMALFSGGLLLALPRMASATAAFRSMWQASLLFRASLVGGVGLIAAITIVPPLLSEGEQKARAYADALEDLGDVASGTAEAFKSKTSRFLNETALEIENLTDEVDNLGFLIPQKLVPDPFRKWSEDVTDAVEKVGEKLTGIPAKIDTAADVQDVLRGRLDAFVEAAQQAGLSYPEAMRLIEESSLDASDAIVKEALEPMRKAFSDSLADVRDAWAPGVEKAMLLAANAAGNSMTIVVRAVDQATTNSELEANIGPLSDQLALIDKIAGQRTREAVAMDLQTNALEQQRVAAQLALPAFDAQIRALEREIGALDLSKAAIGDHIRAVEREISTLNLGKAAIEAQIRARNDLMAATLQAARIANLPQMVEQKKLELERAKILDKVGGATEDLTDADKERLEAIDDELRALRTSMNVKRLEAELTNVQREASDDFRDALKEQLRAIEDEISGLAGQRDALRLNEQAIEDDIEALQGHRKELDLRAQAYQDNITAIEGQITKLGHQRSAIDLVTVAWKLQAQAMLDLPTIKDISADMEQFKKLLRFQLQISLMEAVRDKDIIRVNTLRQRILEVEALSFAQGGFVPPGVVTPAILHGGQFGEIVAPLDRALPSGGDRRIIVQMPINSTFAPDRAALKRAIREVLPEMRHELATLF